MATYYVKVDSPGAWNGRDGSTSAANLLLGYSGLQYAADTIDAGNSIYVVSDGSHTSDSLKDLVCDNQSGNFIRGEAVTWDGGASSGTVSELDGNALPSVIEVITGTLADNDSLSGTSATADVSGAPTIKTFALDIDTNNGGDTVPIIFQGVNAAFSIDGTQAVMDGNGGTTSEIGNYNRSGIRFVNFDFTNASSHGVDLATGGGGDSSFFVDCKAYSNGGGGFYQTTSSFTIVYINCLSYSNTNSGFYNNPRGSLINCISYANGDGGVEAGSTDNLVVLNCIFHDNGDNDENVLVDDNCVFANCIFDGTDQTGEDGLSCQAGMIIIGCRFTNLNVGIDNSNGSIHNGFNYFHDNSTDISSVVFGREYEILDAGSGTNKSDVDADDGYNDIDNHDFNLKASRTYNGDGTETFGLGIGS